MKALSTLNLKITQAKREPNALNGVIMTVETAEDIAAEIRLLDKALSKALPIIRYYRGQHEVDEITKDLSALIRQRSLQRTLDFAFSPPAGEDSNDEPEAV